MNPGTKLKGIFDLRSKWIKEMQDTGRFKAVKVDTTKNLADELTKPLSAATRRLLESELERIKKLTTS